MFEVNQPNYATFWQRAFAYLLDVLIIGSITATLNYLNFITAKSFLFYLLITLPGIIYKPWLEARYGATLGKMAFKVVVVNDDLEQITLQRSILRNLIFIVPSLIYIPYQFLAFNDAHLLGIEDFWQFSQGVGLNYPSMMIFNCFGSLLVLIDLVVLLANDTSSRQSLKDLMAKTYVIKKEQVLHSLDPFQ
jgi:uncharacterized RDD family membrane protein YckC